MTQNGWTAYEVLYYGLERLLIGARRSAWVFVNRILVRLHPGISGGYGFRGTGRIVWRISRGGRIRLGSSVRINSGHLVNPFGGERRTIVMVGPQGVLELGNHVGISGATIIAFEHVSIGDSSLVGGGATICDTDFHPMSPAARRLRGTLGRTRPVRIGRDVFVGGYAFVGKGVSIGDEAVLGARAVVRDMVPARAKVIGNPAVEAGPSAQDSPDEAR